MSQAIARLTTIAAVAPVPAQFNVTGPRCCPWCGTDPGLATRVNGLFLVGCEADECAANPQVADFDLSKAWAKWNGRKGGAL